MFAGQALACGFVMGFLICFTGVGGGVLVIPAVSFFFGLPVSAAIGTASFYTAVTKVFAGMEHSRRGNVNYRLFWKFFAGAAPGAVASAAAVNLALHWRLLEPLAIQEILRWLVAAAIAGSLAFIVAKPKVTAESSPPAFAAGAGIGAVMGATGIGGGVLIAPALLLLGGETPKRVVGTSILIALALSAIAAAVYAGGGQVRFGLAMWMLAGSLLAVPVGGRLLHRVSENFVRRSLLAIVAAALLLMLAGV